jgi:hypothetical protein
MEGAMDDVTQSSSKCMVWLHPFVSVPVGVDGGAAVEGSTSTFGSIAGGSCARPSLTIIKYSCRSYAAAASFAASTYSSVPTATKRSEYTQVCCRSFNTFSQSDLWIAFGLSSRSTKYRSTSLASPIGNRFPEFRTACQCLESSSQATSERSSAPLTSMFQSL